ncbi:MAG: class I SAM-dependent methyltransferase [bacterium]|nr:class I SAM-dependent methyltransferase [bacterium]
MNDPFGLIAEYYDEVMEKVDYEEWARYVKTLLSMAPLKPIKRILDLASGTGNLSIRLKDYGYEIFGLDYSLGMLKVAKKKLSNQLLTIHLVSADFRHIPFKPSSFDAVISTFDSLNNILKPAEMVETFKQIRRVLRNGGPFIFDLNTSWSFKTEWYNLTRVEETANTISIWKSRYVNGIVYLHFTLFVRIDKRNHYKKIYTVFRERGYSPDEVKKYLKQAGFSKVHCYDHFTLSPGRRTSSRVTYLAY